MAESLAIFSRGGGAAAAADIPLAAFPTVGATRVWNGGFGSWSSAANWTTAGGPADYPRQTDSLFVARGTAVLHGNDAKEAGTFDTVTVMLGAGAADTATLSLDEAVVGASFFVNPTGNAAILSTGTSYFQGYIDADNFAGTLQLGSRDGGNLVFTQDLYAESIDAAGATGTIEFVGTTTFEAAAGFSLPATLGVVNSGTVNQLSASTTIGGPVSGTGTFNLQFATTLHLEGDVAAGQVIHFGDVDGRLQLSSPATFYGTVTNFSPGNLIDFTGIAYDAGTLAARLDAGTHVLTLTDGGRTVATLGNVYGSAGPLEATWDSKTSGGVTVRFADTPARMKYEVADGDRAMGSDIVRATMNVPGTTTPITGKDVKIGIISDTFHHDLKQANANAQAGYLPSTISTKNGTPEVVPDVRVIAGRDGPEFADYSTEDEGQAMAILVHQVAPDATIYFASSSGGQDEAYMAASVKALVDAGCQIIIDDWRFLHSARDQNAGTIVRAVSDAVANHDVNYFTCAYNTGHGFYESAFSTREVKLADGQVVQANIFGNGTPYLPLSLKSGYDTPIDLQWSLPFEGTSGMGAANALTFKIFDSSGKLVGISAQNQEDVTPENSANPTTRATAGTSFDFTPAVSGIYYLAVYGRENAPRPDSFSVNILANSADDAIIDPAAATKGGNLGGQELIADVNTVGAIFYGQSAAFGRQPGTNEYFSDYGPGELLFDADGKAFASPQSAGKVDFSAPDGVYTPVSGFEPFFGSSAAAPNAGAVAALMLQADPRLTHVQVSYLLTESAIPFGRVAAQSGAGLIQAPTAVQGAITAATTPIWTAQGGSPQWNEAANWSNNAVPTGAETVRLTNGLGLFNGGYVVTYGSSAGTIGGLVVDGMGTAAPRLIVDPRGSLYVDGLATIARGGALQVQGLFDAKQIALDVSGSLTFGGAAARSVSATLSGTGTVSVDGSGVTTLLGANTFTGGTSLICGTLDLAHATVLGGDGAILSAAAGTGAITFATGAQTLRLDPIVLGSDAGRSFANTIANFGTDGDVIDLRGIRQTATAQFDYTSNTLTLGDAAGTAATLHLGGRYQGHAFDAASDGAGGVAITSRIVTDILASADRATVQAHAIATGNVLANDTSPYAGAALHVTSVRFASGFDYAVAGSGVTTVSGEHGTLQIAADGRYGYIGARAGADLFTVTIADGHKVAAASLTASVAAAAIPSDATFDFAFASSSLAQVGGEAILTDAAGGQHDVTGIGTLRFTDGTIVEKDGSPLVDDLFYYARYKDVWAAHAEAETHYAEFGWREGRDPNALFSTDAYLAANGDVKAAGTDPLQHYDSYGWKEGRTAGIAIAADAYRATNDDVKAAGVDPLAHYLGWGQAEGRVALPGESVGTTGHHLYGAFDATFYLASYGDVASAASQSRGDADAFALVHYLQYGASEGRDPNALFSTRSYLDSNADVKAAGLNPLLHYEFYGEAEGRSASGFDANGYLAANPDVAQAHVDPLQHYLQYGMAEGRGGWQV